MDMSFGHVSNDCSTAYRPPAWEGEVVTMNLLCHQKQEALGPLATVTKCLKLSPRGRRQESPPTRCFRTHLLTSKLRILTIKSAMQPSHLILRLAVLTGAIAFAAPVHAQLTPESPQVQRMIAAGMKYLETAADGRLGGDCLIGLCHFKNSGDAKHPAVARALAACGRVCRLDADEINTDIYSTGIAIFFLCEVDAEGHSSDIEKLVQSLILRQKKGGGWGYPDGTHQATGDTSMTQYAVLGLWAAKGHGVRVPDEVVVRVGDWLIRTQDPSGGWGYQGNDPGNFVKVKQTQVKKSLTAAGLGSTYICASMLGISHEKEDRNIAGLPAAFQRVVEKPADGGKPKPADLDPRRLRAAHADGIRWFAQNFDVIDEAWVYYYLYAYERYMSFRELVEGREVGGGWYDRGAKFLAKQQNEDGRWQSNAGADGRYGLRHFVSDAGDKEVDRDHD